MKMLTENQLKKVSALQSRAIVVGAVGCIIALFGGYAVGGGMDGLEKVFQPFLIAFILCFGLGVCGLAVVMLHHLCGGAWSYTIQRIAEASSRTLPFFAIAGAVIVLGGFYVGNIYSWANPENLGNLPHIVEIKHNDGFLTQKAFLGTFIGCFAIWLVLMQLFNSWSKNLDETGNLNNIGKMKFWAGPGLILYVATMTLAATYWCMSLEPEWFSTIYGAWLMGGYALTFVAFAVLVLSWLADEGPLAEKVSIRTYHHLGNFMLGFVVFWSYISFSQFLLIWNANLPEEVGFYLHRQGHGLNLLTVGLMVFHFGLPMFMLLIRRNKTEIHKLRLIAYYVLAVRVLDIYWNLVPAWEGNRSTINPATFVLVIAASLGLGGVWLWVFLAELKKRPLLPVNDPRGELLFVKDAH